MIPALSFLRPLCMCTVALCLSAVAPIALAHNPRAERSDWGNFDAPYVVEDGTISYAFFGSLPDVNDVDVVRLDFQQPSVRLVYELLVPLCGALHEQFFPVVALFAESFSTAEAAPPALNELLLGLPDDPHAVTEHFGAFPPRYQLISTYSSRNDRHRTPFHEIHTRRDYYASEEIQLLVDQPGSYYLVVYVPMFDGLPASGGAYLLSTGSREIFLAPLESEPADVSLNWEAHWMTQPCDALPATPTADASAEATSDPTGEPTGEPTASPTGEPTGEPTAEPTGDPTAQPTAEATASLP